MENCSSRRRRARGDIPISKFSARREGQSVWHCNDLTEAKLCWLPCTSEDSLWPHRCGLQVPQTQVSPPPPHLSSTDSRTPLEKVARARKKSPLEKYRKFI